MSAHPEASNKARAISRGADLVAAYASDARGWAGTYDTMNGADVMALKQVIDAATVADAIADILHVADHMGIETDYLMQKALWHYHGERDGDLDTAWSGVPESDVEYVPAIASTGTVTVRTGIMALLLDAAREHVEYRHENAQYEAQHYPDGEYGDTTRAIANAIEEGERA